MMDQVVPEWIEVLASPRLHLVILVPVLLAHVAEFVYRPDPSLLSFIFEGLLTVVAILVTVWRLGWFGNFAPTWSEFTDPQR